MGIKVEKFLRGGRNEDIVKFDKTGNKFHPTEKPVDMLEFFIKNSCCENGIVFDGFGGSGSTYAERMKDLLDYADCNSLNAISGVLRHIGMDKESAVLLRIEEKIILTIERRMTESEIHKEM